MAPAGIALLFLITLLGVASQKTDFCEQFSKKYGCIDEFRPFCENHPELRNESEFLTAWAQISPRAEKLCTVPYPTFFVEEIVGGVILFTIFIILRGIELVCFPVETPATATPPATPERRASI